MRTSIFIFKVLKQCLIDNEKSTKIQTAHEVVIVHVYNLLFKS